MEWSDVRIFLAVARSGSLGGAARSLKLSHPTVARRLRALEDDTGQVLLQRHREGVVLTDAGNAIVRLAEEMEASALAMQRRLAGVRNKAQGRLRISSADWFASYVLPPVLQAMATSHPEVLPEVITGARLFDVARREADIVFRVVPSTDAGIVQRRLMRLRYDVYVSESLAATKIEDDGAGAQLVLMDTAKYDYPDVTWLRRRLPRAGVVMTSNSRSLQAGMCARGLGLAVLPRAVGEQTPGLRQIDLGEPPPSRDIWMGYHEDLRDVDRLRAMVDLTVKMLGDEP
ncbi:Transcriptional regulator, LysR family [Labilithrix luteola]|uniref:Transcriptional regulator, LysR family n=1 Tax=Labilithrix luteola TaxID=1391654 RepID=A0A0K1PPU0_9BACT|nr:LysR family transcriptional regulator [Labilithrix luteola]AKU95537.1 Transcriptional regulator, LysR family [Labilithrix luteola]